MHQLQNLFNPLVHNVLKWPDTLQVCLIILGHYALKS